VKGFFLAHGLDVQPMVSTSNVEAAALASGELDFSGQFPAAIRQRLAGLGVLPVAAVVAHSTRHLLAMPGYNTVQDLRGKTLLGSSPAGTDTQVLRRMLAVLGLDPDRDVNVLNAGDAPGRWAVLQSGNAEGVLFSGGDVLVAHEMGMKTLARAADVLDMPENGLSVSDRKLAEQPELVKRALRALLDAVSFIEREPAEAARILAQWTGVEERQALPQIELLLPALSPDLTVAESAVREVIEAEKASAGITRDVPVSEMSNFTLLQEVLRERGR
jgi:ABC-type nitrate/sulfonate/bicarbonate transport system substrate-binding protein